MRVPVNFETTNDVQRFTEIVKNVKEDVRLIGKDENGQDWNISGKSLFCSLVIAAKLQHREHTAHEVDWNTIYCECEKDIYTKIQDFIRVSPIGIEEAHT